MAPISNSRNLVVHPASVLIDFLGAGYASKGVGVASLKSLVSIYDTPSLLRLGNLQPNLSHRAERAGAPQPTATTETAFQVVFFKKLGRNVPTGITSKSLLAFFVAQFSYGTPRIKRDFIETTQYLVDNNTYHKLAITALVFDPNENSMVHYIVGAAVFMHDKNGSFIFTIGVHDKGDPRVCSLSPQFFKEPIGPSTPVTPFLSASACFRQKGLATFMLSLIQILGHTGYKPPVVDNSNDSYNICCDETSSPSNPTKAHHLYLQARVETESAYVFYVKLGFALHNPNPNQFHCCDFKKECPVHATKGQQYGYYIDDRFQRLLSLQHWLYNVYPPDAIFTTDLEDPTNLLWNIPGLPADQYLSSALAVPQFSDASIQFTNGAYSDLLNCRLNIGTKPLAIATRPDDLATYPLPPDRYRAPPTRTTLNHQIIAGTKVSPVDVRRLLFRGLDVHSENGSLDAFGALTVPLYFGGQLVTPSDDIAVSPQMDEMTLELRLNLAAFYFRCGHYVFTNECLESWALSICDEYACYAQSESKLSECGLTSFRPMNVLTTNRTHNFILLGRRLTVTQTNAKLKAPLAADLFTLQLLFSRQARPVYIAPVYGMIGSIITDGRTTSHYALAQVPEMSDLWGNNTVEGLLAPYTVVPIMPLDDTSFGFFSTLSTSATIDITDDNVRAQLPLYRSFYENNLELFQRLPMMRINPEEATFTAGHCASNWLCQLKSASTASDILRCPGCGKNVHNVCGISYVAKRIPYRYKVTCYLCYDRFQRALAGSNDPDFFAEDALEPNTNTTTERAPALQTTTTVSSPSKSTRAQSKLPMRINIPPTGKLVMTRQEKSMSFKIAQVNAQVDQHNPHYMYPDSDSSTDKDDEADDDNDIKWWRNGKDTGPRKGVAPKSNRHAAKSPIESHVYSRKEMEAFGGSQRNVQPKAFNVIIKSAISLGK
jgi:hypothetical protein